MFISGQKYDDKNKQKKYVILLHMFKLNLLTRCTQREQNTQLNVTSLTSVIKFCKENNKIKPNMKINVQWISPN